MWEDDLVVFTMSNVCILHSPFNSKHTITVNNWFDVFKFLLRYFLDVFQLRHLESFRFFQLNYLLKGNIISVFVSPTRWVLALISEFYSDNWTTKLIWCSPSCLLFYRNVGPLIQSLFFFRSYIADTSLLLQRSAGLLFPITWYHWSVFASSRISDTLFATYFEAMIFIFYILNIIFRHCIHRHTHDTRDVLDGALWVIAWQFLVVGIRWY